MQSVTYPIVKHKFLSSAQLSRFNNYLAGTNRWEPSSVPVWADRSINLNNMRGDLREELLDLRVQVKEIIQESLEVKRDLFGDIFQFVRWRTSDVLHPHADAENPDGSAHPFPYRNFASVLYLNKAYEGGQVYFPKRNLTPAVEPGTLLIFPGTLDYLHGVTQVTAGTRYTIAGFFTYDQRHHDGLRI